MSFYLNLTVLCLHNLLFLALNAWKFDIIIANLFVPFSLPAIALFFHSQHKLHAKSIFFLLNVYIKLSCAYVCLPNDLIMILKTLKNLSRKFSLTAVHFLRAHASNTSIRNSNFPILLSHKRLFSPSSSHHHLSMLLFDFIQQTDISLFGFLNYRRRCVYSSRLESVK
jgi:hypothetical protein